MTEHSLNELNSVAIRVLRRLGSGQRVEQLRNYFSSATGHRQLMDHKLVTLHSTPKGRKSWYEITEAGSALLPLIRKRDAENRTTNEKAQAEEQRIERIRDASPDLLRELRTSPCPGGGYTGQPEGEEPTVDNCLKAGVCGCSAGAAVRKATGA